jgi:hypothetical protein
MIHKLGLNRIAIRYFRAQLYMTRIEIYSSKRKSFLLLVGSLLFVVCGIYIFMVADDPHKYRSTNPLFERGIGVLCVVFFGLGIYLSIRHLIKNRLILVIDEVGLNVNPNRAPGERIEWKNIEGFSEIKIHSTKIVIIEVNNSHYWIEKETNKLKKMVMKFNSSNYGSPFNLSANSMQINHSNLLKLLKENLSQFKSTLR